MVLRSKLGKGEEAPLEFAVVGHVEVGAAEAVDDLGKRRSVLHVLIHYVMHGRGAGWDRPPGR